MAPCSFELDAAPRGGAEYVRVTVDGVDYALGDANGWDMVGESTVALRESGTACEKIREGKAITIKVECVPVVVK